MAALTQALDWRKNDLHSCSIDDERLDFLFQFSKRDFLHSGPFIRGVYQILFVVRCAMKSRSNSVCLVVIAIVVLEIFLFS